jgi:hypothetical protein
MRTPSTYEPGMRFIFDADTGAVTVYFRGRITALRGSYVSEADARAAGEGYCRRLGWREPSRSIEDGWSLLAHRRAS